MLKALRTHLIGHDEKTAMLTDIFAERYSHVRLWHSFYEDHKRLMVQSFRIVSEQLFPYWSSEGQERHGAKAQWKSLHDRLSMELGLQQLSRVYYSYPNTTNGQTKTVSDSYTFEQVCRTFVCADYDPTISADEFIKSRLSFIEIAFRTKGEQIAAENATLSSRLTAAEHAADSLLGGLRLPGNPVDGIKARNTIANREFQDAVEELNERLRRAGTNLNYHNGFIQVSEDKLTEGQIETPFWDTVNNPKWQNVDTDMKEAIDLRDAGGRDPAFYAARALESAIKIISNEKGWTHGGERGAHSFIDNLASSKNGSFIAKWEQETLKSIFTHVRNPLGHGPGEETMPELTKQQTNWAIETCMSWTKSLILRM